MEWREKKPELRNDADDNGDADQVTSRARLRMADLMRQPFDVRSVALTGLFILAIFYTIYFLRAVLLPIVLAWLLSYLLRPLVRTLSRIKIPPLLGAALILLALLSIVTLGVSALAVPASGWLAKAPSGLQELQHKLMPMKRSIAQMAKAGGEIEKLATPDSGSKAAVEVQRHPITETLYMRTPEFISSMILLLVILLFFLLAYDGVFIGKLIKLLPSFSDKKRAVSIAQDIESQVSRYLFTVTIINCCLGIAVGTTVGLLGLPNPVMWGVMVAILNFVPYLGALTGIICMTIGAILSFDSLGYALIFP